MVTLAITTHNRDNLTYHSFKQVLNDDRISEIVIVDDCSDIRFYENLKSMVRGLDKVKLYRNDRNLGCYHNKRKAVEMSTNEWVILFDSDNVIKRDYLDALPDVLYPNKLYAPSFAKPHFDYRHFSLINQTSIRDNINKKNFEAMMNTCNFFVNREEYLKVFDQEIKEPWTADTLYFNYCWLKAGNEIHVTHGLHYDHLVHNGSHYKANVRKTGDFANQIMNKLRQL